MICHKTKPNQLVPFTLSLGEQFIMVIKRMRLELLIVQWDLTLWPYQVGPNNHCKILNIHFVFVWVGNHPKRRYMILNYYLCLFCVIRRSLDSLWLSCTYLGEIFIWMTNSSKFFTIQAILNFFIILFTNPSARAGYDTRSISKRSLTGLNSEFSFS